MNLFSPVYLTLSVHELLFETTLYFTSFQPDLTLYKILVTIKELDLAFSYPVDSMLSKFTAFGPKCKNATATELSISCDYRICRSKRLSWLDLQFENKDFRATYFSGSVLLYALSCLSNYAGNFTHFRTSQTGHKRKQTSEPEDGAIMEVSIDMPLSNVIVILPEYLYTESASEACAAFQRLHFKYGSKTGIVTLDTNLMTICESLRFNGFAKNLTLY